MTVTFLGSSDDLGANLSSEGMPANVPDNTEQQLPESSDPIAKQDDLEAGLPAEVASEKRSIPKLPLAKRINSADNTKAEYEISDGVFSISIGIPIP